MKVYKRLKTNAWHKIPPAGTGLRCSCHLFTVMGFRWIVGFRMTFEKVLPEEDFAGIGEVNLMNFGQSYVLEFLK